MKSATVFALFAVLLMSGCDAMVSGASSTIQGNGIARQEARKVESFHEVEISSTFEVTITIGPRPSVSLLVDDNLARLVETYVENERLFVRHAEGSTIITTKPQKVTVVVPSLDRIIARGASKLFVTTVKCKSLLIDAAGASAVQVEGLDCEVVELNADGAGRIKMAGKGKSLTVDALGASKLSGGEASFESAKIVMEGASRCEFEVTGSIAGDLSGASNLTILGNPAHRSVKTTRAARVFY